MLKTISREYGSASVSLGWDRWGTNGLMAGTIAGHLAAVKFFPRQERGLELFLRHPWVVDVLKRVPRSRAEVGTKSRIRRPGA